MLLPGPAGHESVFVFMFYFYSFRVTILHAHGIGANNNWYIIVWTKRWNWQTTRRILLEKIELFSANLCAYCCFTVSRLHTKYSRQNQERNVSVWPGGWAAFVFKLLSKLIINRDLKSLLKQTSEKQIIQDWIVRKLWKNMFVAYNIH